MFQLAAEESRGLGSHFATLKSGRGQHREYAPYACTEHGAIMAATILNSPRAIDSPMGSLSTYSRPDASSS
jgi:ORF6N domain-containing protein